MSKLTIYITTYNRVQYLKRMIDSVLSQTYSDFNVIILDNCSTDGTEEYAKGIQDNRVSYHRNEENLGGAGNINQGFYKSKTEYFCVFHDDDICHKELLETEISYMESHPECVAVSCLNDQIDRNGEIVKRCQKENNDETIYAGTTFFEAYLVNHTSMTFPPTMYRTEFIRGNGIRLNTSPGPCGDVVLFMDIEKHGGIMAQINRNLFSYRVYSDQDSTTNLESMLIKLMEFLKTDEYYRVLLESIKGGKEKYYRWYCRRLLVRVASGKISAQNAVEFLDKMRNLTNGSEKYYLFTRIVLQIEHAMPGLFSFAYHRIKG